MALPSSLLFATSNRGKLEELRTFVASRGSAVRCVIPADLGKPAPDVEETGTTYRANAWLKAQAYFAVFGVPVLADDSGLEVDALNGEPGLYSARLGGEGISWPERWGVLFGLLQGHPQPWTARFRCVLCYFDGKSPRYFEGTVEGHIVPVGKGVSGFGYDPIFYCPELGQTFGEATAADKDRVSHRARALEAFWKTLTLA